MQLGLALPQYDSFSVPGTPRLDWPTLRTWATTAEQAGFDSLWLSDHIVWAIDRYGAAPGNHEGFEPLTTLAALARTTTRPTTTLGTLVLATPIRPPAVLAKALTTVDLLAHGRLIAGLGAGWFEPDYELTGQTVPPPAQRLHKLSEAIDAIKETFANANPDRPNQPPPAQQPHPPIWLGGKGPRLIELAATKADGWNYCWTATPEDYKPKLDAALDKAPDPDRFHPSLGIYTLVGENHHDLEAKFDRLKAESPPGVIAPGTTLDEYRQGRLVGTVEEVAEQAARWKALGVQTLIACLGPVPFSVTHLDDLQAVASAVQTVR